MLWTLLLSICFLIAIAGAVNSAEATQVGWLGYVLAIIAGSSVGAGCVWAMSTIARVVEVSTATISSNRLRDRYFGALYASTILWMALAAIAGSWLATTLMRIVR